MIIPLEREAIEALPERSWFVLKLRGQEDAYRICLKVGEVYLVKRHWEFITIEEVLKEDSIIVANEDIVDVVFGGFVFRRVLGGYWNPVLGGHIILSGKDVLHSDGIDSYEVVANLDDLGVDEEEYLESILASGYRESIALFIDSIKRGVYFSLLKESEGSYWLYGTVLGKEKEDLVVKRFKGERDEVVEEVERFLEGLGLMVE